MLTKYYVRFLRWLSKAVASLAQRAVDALDAKLDREIKAVQALQVVRDEGIQATATLALAKKQNAQKAYHDACKKADEQAAKVTAKIHAVHGSRVQAQDRKVAKLANKAASI